MTGHAHGRAGADRASAIDRGRALDARARRQLLRARVEQSAARLLLTPVGGPGVAPDRRPGQADALVVLAEDVTRVEQGDQVPVLLLDRPVG